LLFVQLVLSLLLLLKLQFQLLLLPEGLLGTAALSRRRTRQSSTRICFFRANRFGKKRETQQEAGCFHRHFAPICNDHWGLLASNVPKRAG